MSESTLLLVALGVLAYGAIELTEAVGLWLMRRWGEYVAAVGTGVFVPLEVYELLERTTWVRIAALTVNAFAVVYLLWTKRLFGIRGGHRAFEDERIRCWRSSGPRPSAKPSGSHADGRMHGRALRTAACPRPGTWCCLHCR